MNTTNELLKKLTAADLYARFSGILSLSDIPLFLADTNGQILLEFVPSPDFCTHVCKERNGKVCPEYLTRFEAGEEGRFVCRHGLENFIVPIRVSDEIIGYIGGMQVYQPETEYQKYMVDLQSLKEEDSPDLEFIAKAIAALKTADDTKISIHEQLCHHIAKNLSFELSESANHTDPDVARLSIEKEMLEKKIIDLEAKNMSLVINPHFLFNTLNCIARIAYFEHSHTTEELIYCLSDLLRYNLKQDDQLHTIGSEMENIEKYLYIQKARFKNRLDYEINVPDSVRSCRIPNMVIQPVVENALIHGITPKRDGGKIVIEAEEFKQEIVITVSDNGNGFPKEVLDNIMKGDGSAGLGYSTTDQRLKKYYGEGYGLRIVKSDFSGSSIAITIPTQQPGRLDR